MEQAEYEKDFEPKDLARLRWQLERAQTVISVPPAAEEEPADPDRDFREFLWQFSFLRKTFISLRVLEKKSTSKER